MDVDDDPWTEEEAVVCIPFTPGGKTNDDRKASLNSFPAAAEPCDIPDGSRARYELYNSVWKETETKIKTAASRVYDPILNDIYEVIIESGPSSGKRPQDEWIKRLMLSTELQTVLVVGEDKEELFGELASRLAKDDIVALSTLSPSSLVNLQAGLKALVEGFIRKHEERRRRPAASLATHDLLLLEVWYKWLSGNGSSPKLVVLVQDLEICNAAVVHDLLQVCSNYAAKLPFVFVLGASSSDIMTTMFSRATRSLLSIKRFAMPSELRILESVLQQVLFDLSSLPSLVLSGNSLSWLYHSWSSFHGSLNGLMSHLQLIYIRHFRNPSSLFWKDPMDQLSLPKKWSSAKDEGTTAFFQSFSSQLSGGKVNGGGHDLLPRIKAATEQFQSAIEEAKFAFLILIEVQAYLREISQQSHLPELSTSFVQLAQLFGDGRLDDISSRLVMRVKLLNRLQLLGLVQRVSQAPVPNRLSEASPLTEARALVQHLSTDVGTEKEERDKHKRSGEFALCLGPILLKMSSWRSLPLVDVWRTTDKALPIDILNPSMRSTILGALMQPGNYLLHDVHRGSKRQERNGTEGTHLEPDISVMFSRYANAGRTINLYDWLESYTQAMESSRPKKVAKTASTKTKGGKGKGKVKKNVEADGDNDDDDGADDEAWRRELYGRFMWSVHEMDMLGLLRWTGRGTGKKGAECAGKVVWVTPEE